jgi:hypothetical protein
MTSHYDIKTERWIVTSGCITVKGPTRQACEERVRRMEEDLCAARAENDAERLRLFRDSVATEY